MPTSPRQYRFRIRFSNGMGDRLVLGRADNIHPYISAYVVQMAGRPRAASPTIRFRKRHSKGRADNIRPYISAYVVQTVRADNIRPYIYAYVVQMAGRTAKRRGSLAGAPWITSFSSFCRRYS